MKTAKLIVHKNFPLYNSFYSLELKKAKTIFVAIYNINGEGIAFSQVKHNKLYYHTQICQEHKIIQQIYGNSLYCP